MRYVFNLTILVDGNLHTAGEEVDEAKIPSGCLASLKRLGQVSPVEAAGPSLEVETETAKPKKK